MALLAGHPSASYGSADTVSQPIVTPTGTEANTADERTVAYDTELIARSRRGDLDAFSLLTVRYQDVAFRVAFSVTADQHDAEDAVQEGFIRAFRALDRFRDGLPFRPWLLKIVLNEARGRRRVRARGLRLSLRVGSFHQEELDTDPMDSVLLHERGELLAAAIAKLGPEHRRVIYCRYFLDLDEAETAVVLGCPRGTVKSRLSRAIGQLRTILAPENAA